MKNKKKRKPRTLPTRFQCLYRTCYNKCLPNKNQSSGAYIQQRSVLHSKYSVYLYSLLSIDRNNIIIYASTQSNINNNIINNNDAVFFSIIVNLLYLLIEVLFVHYAGIALCKVEL